MACGARKLYLMYQLEGLQDQCFRAEYSLSLRVTLPFSLDVAITNWSMCILLTS